MRANFCLDWFGLIMLLLVNGCATPPSDSRIVDLSISNKSEKEKTNASNSPQKTNLQTEEKPDAKVDIGDEKQDSAVVAIEKVKDGGFGNDNNISIVVPQKSEDSTVLSKDLIESENTTFSEEQGELPREVSSQLYESRIEPKLGEKGVDDMISEANLSTNTDFKELESSNPSLENFRSSQLIGKISEEELEEARNGKLKEFFVNPDPIPEKSNSKPSSVKLSAKKVERDVKKELLESSPGSPNLILTKPKLGKIELESERKDVEKEKDNPFPSVQNGKFISLSSPIETEKSGVKKDRVEGKVTFRSDHLTALVSTNNNQNRRIGLRVRNEDVNSSLGLVTSRVGFKDLNKVQHKSIAKVAVAERVPNSRKVFEGFGKIRSFLNRKDVTEDESILGVETDFYRSQSYLYPAKNKLSNEITEEFLEPTTNRYEKTLNWIRSRGRNSLD